MTLRYSGGSVTPALPIGFLLTSIVTMQSVMGPRINQLSASCAWDKGLPLAFTGPMVRFFPVDYRLRILLDLFWGHGYFER